MVRPLLLLLMLVPLVGAAEPPPVTLTGMIVKVRWQHPNGQWYHALVLRLDETYGWPGDGFVEAQAVDEVHVFSSVDQVQATLTSLAGRRVAITGVPFGGHTAWHRRRVVLPVTAWAVKDDKDEVAPPP